MAHGFKGTAVIDRPIEQVFEFLAAGVNDKAFSPRVQEIRKTTDGPPGVGTIFASTVKDAGMKTTREFEYTEFQAPTKLRWKELTKNSITVPNGGYDLSPAGEGKTRLTIFNELAGHGIGKLLLPLAARAAQSDADAFAGRIKAAVEGS